jgi:excinuclease ABC subunit C
MQVQAACDFLDGQCAEMERQLEADMQTAAAELDFEKAANLRDLLTDLRHTTEKVRRFPRVPYSLPIATNPERELNELARLLGLPAAPARIEGFDISNISGAFAVASMVSFWQGRPDRAGYRRFKMKTVVGQDDCACIAETVRRRYSRLLREAGATAGQPAGGETAPARLGAASSRSAPKLPDLVLIDGGKGQLNAARAELERLGLGAIPVVGLAKEFEEVYGPGVSAPLPVGPGSGALKLLQRIRDESHRFANTYNAQLRLKRISESLLDEFPGIGQQRKTALLRRFGSVHRLRLATVEQIAKVPGFGGKAAAELKAFLAARTVRAPGPLEESPNRSAADSPCTPPPGQCT